MGGDLAACDCVHLDHSGGFYGFEVDRVWSGAMWVVNCCFRRRGDRWRLKRFEASEHGLLGKAQDLGWCLNY